MILENYKVYKYYKCKQIWMLQNSDFQSKWAVYLKIARFKGVCSQFQCHIKDYFDLNHKINSLLRQNNHQMALFL